jgi:hypothetical protein
MRLGIPTNVAFHASTHPLHFRHYLTRPRQSSIVIVCLHLTRSRVKCPLFTLPSVLSTVYPAPPRNIKQRSVSTVFTAPRAVATAGSFDASLLPVREVVRVTRSRRSNHFSIFPYFLRRSMPLCANPGPCVHAHPNALAEAPTGF